jgi:hypothetical protein
MISSTTRLQSLIEQMRTLDMPKTHAPPPLTTTEYLYYPKGYAEPPPTPDDCRRMGMCLIVCAHPDLDKMCLLTNRRYISHKYLFSLEVTLCFSALVPPPQGVRVQSLSENEVVVTWAPVPNADSYEVLLVLYLLEFQTSFNTDSFHGRTVATERTA